MKLCLRRPSYNFANNKSPVHSSFSQCKLAMCPCVWKVSLKLCPVTIARQLLPANTHVSTPAPFLLPWFYAPYEDGRLKVLSSVSSVLIRLNLMGYTDTHLIKLEGFLVSPGLIKTMGTVRR